jgi:hypothetical protein
MIYFSFGRKENKKEFAGLIKQHARETYEGVEV